MSSDNLWWLGVILITCGSIGNNLGNNLVSLSFKKEQTSANGVESSEQKSIDDESNKPSVMDDEDEGGVGMSIDPEFMNEDSHIPEGQFLQVTLARSMSMSLRRSMSNTGTIVRTLSSSRAAGQITALDDSNPPTEEMIKPMPGSSQSYIKGLKQRAALSTKPTTPLITKRPSREDHKRSTIAVVREEERFDLELLENQSTSAPSETPPPKPNNWLWGIGTFIFVVGNLLTFVAFGFGSQSLLAALESVQFLSNVFFVSMVHKEKISWRVLASTGAIICGCILVVIFSDHAATLYTSNDINQIYLTNTGYQIYAGCAIAFCILNTFVFRYYHHARTILNQDLWQHGFIEPLSYVISSAILGTQAVLQSKTLSVLLQVTFTQENQFAQPTIYIVLASWLFFVSFWLNRLNRGLELFPPLFIIPVLQVFFILFAIVSGGIFFSEFVSFGPAEYAGFIIGIMLIFVGVYGLAPPGGAIRKPSIKPMKEVNDSHFVLNLSSTSDSKASSAKIQGKA